jgi:RNA polymerase sigma-70 factor, ECF subfamily
VLSQEELTLLTGLARGDRQSFKQLFDTYHGRLYSISYHMMRDSAKAKDIVQEVFIKLWNTRERVKVTTSLDAYLKRAVINTTLNVIESDKRHSIISLFTPTVSSQLDRHTTADSHEANDLQRAIDQAILSLPARTRAVFVLVRMEEMSYDQASASLNISNKAVEKEMMKALRLLRDQLRNYLPVSLIPAVAFLFG